MVINNKDVIRNIVKEYAMDGKKNVYFKKNDGKRMVVKCQDGCKFYMRFNKKVGINIGKLIVFLWACMS